MINPIISERGLYLSLSLSLSFALPLSSLCILSLALYPILSLAISVSPMFSFYISVSPKEPQLDPLQFAYKTKRGVEDAVLVFANNALKHMENPKTFVRILFIDFSSAFNTIQPHIMVGKLLPLSVNKNLIAYILDFLTNRTQYVKLNETISNLCKLNTGAPQGCVLSPTLYTLYTNDYRVKHSDTSLIKFADDSAFQGLFTNRLDSNYIAEVYRFVKWCEENYLILNVSKTKEMIIDFRRQKSTPPPLVKLYTLINILALQ